MRREITFLDILRYKSPIGREGTSISVYQSPWQNIDQWISFTTSSIGSLGVFPLDFSVMEFCLPINFGIICAHVDSIRQHQGFCNVCYATYDKKER
jgi:hypothetical protein